MVGAVILCELVACARRVRAPEPGCVARNVTCQVRTNDQRNAGRLFADFQYSFGKTLELAADVVF